MSGIILVIIGVYIEKTALSDYFKKTGISIIVEAEKAHIKISGLNSMVKTNENDSLEEQVSELEKRFESFQNKINKKLKILENEIEDANITKKELEDEFNDLFDKFSKKTKRRMLLNCVVLF